MEAGSHAGIPCPLCGEPLTARKGKVRGKSIAGVACGCGFHVFVGSTPMVPPEMCSTVVRQRLLAFPR